MSAPVHTPAPFPWLPIYTRRQRDPRLALAARQLRKKAPEVHGYIVFAMASAAEHYQDGVFRADPALAHTAEQVFDAAAGWAGKASLAAALLAHGLLVLAEGGLMLDGWKDEQGAQFAKFERERERKARARTADEAGTLPGDSEDIPRPVRAPSADAPRPVRVQERQGQGEERRTEASPPAVAADAPPSPVFALEPPTSAPQKPAATSPKSFKQPPLPSRWMLLWGELAAQRAAALGPGGIPEDVAPKIVNAQLKRLVELHGEPTVRAAWAAWLRSDYARGLVPAFAFTAFTSDVQSRKFITLAKEEAARAAEQAAPKSKCAACDKDATGKLDGVATCSDCYLEATQHDGANFVERVRGWFAVKGLRAVPAEGSAA